MNVIWHDIECGGYVEDLPLWRGLAEEHGSPVLDVGAGTGRVALHLARRGHSVTALEREPALLETLAQRAEGLDLETVLADARSFELGRRFPLCIMPMQTIQLLGGGRGRAEFLACAHRHLEAAGTLAVALSPELEPYRVQAGFPAPLPDMRELDGVVYASHPVAVRPDQGGYVLERRREIVTPAGSRSVEANQIHLDELDADQLEREAISVGLEPAGRLEVSATSDYVGSVVVLLRG